MIKTLIFDLGGVLVHLNREESVRRFISLGIKDADSMLDPYLQRGAFLGIEDGSVSTDQFENILSQKAARTISYDDVYHALMGFLQEVSEDKLQYIGKLREQYRVLILSNTNPYIRQFTRSADFTSDGSTLDDFVHHVYASFEMKAVKPHEEIFLQMIAKEHLTPTEALFVDDGERNIEAAARLGFVTLCPQNGEDWRQKVDDMLNRHRESRP